MTGCANFYTTVSLESLVASPVSETEKKLAVALARNVASSRSLRENPMPAGAAAIPHLLADFGDGTLWLQVWSPGQIAQIEFTIGELGAWEESTRSREVRDDLQRAVAQQFPSLQAPFQHAA